jgi:hypothetical protein
MTAATVTYIEPYYYSSAKLIPYTALNFLNINAQSAVSSICDIIISEVSPSYCCSFLLLSCLSLIAAIFPHIAHLAGVSPLFIEATEM